MKMFPIKERIFGSNNEVADLSFLKQVASHKGLVISYGCFLVASEGIEPIISALRGQRLNRLTKRPFWTLTYPKVSPYSQFFLHRPRKLCTFAIAIALYHQLNVLLTFAVSLLTRLPFFSCPRSMSIFNEILMKPETYYFVVYHINQPAHKVKIQHFGHIKNLIL